MVANNILQQLTCVAELSIKNYILNSFNVTFFGNGTGFPTYYIRQFFHDTIDFNNLTSDGITNNGNVSGTDFCLHNGVIVNPDGTLL